VPACPCVIIELNVTAAAAARMNRPSIIDHRSSIIDHCSGSAYYQTYDNFFAFAANGLKSDFNGHDNRHFRNVYGYVDNCWGYGQNNWFVNNTCVANAANGGFRSDCEKKDMHMSGANAT
jgi:hypothetical protein